MVAQALRSQNRRERAEAAIIIGRAGDHGALAALETMAEEADDLVAIAALYALSCLLGAPCNVARMTAALATDDEETMQLAVHTLCELGDDAVPELERILTATSPVKMEIVRQWLAKADQDRRACESLLAAEPPFLYPACFHAQQAAEKYLKALLTWHQIECPKTHAIERLLDLLAPTVPEIVSGLWDAVALTPFGVDIRYPSDQPEPDLQEAHQAMEIAEKVQKAVLEVLQGHI